MVNDFRDGWKYSFSLFFVGELFQGPLKAPHCAGSFLERMIELLNRSLRQAQGALFLAQPLLSTGSGNSLVNFPST
jgi:hypothetical protein